MAIQPKMSCTYKRSIYDKVHLGRILLYEIKFPKMPQGQSSTLSPYHWQFNNIAQTSPLKIVTLSISC